MDQKKPEEIHDEMIHIHMISFLLLIIVYDPNNIK